MNIETNLLEEYINFVDLKKKQIKFLKIIRILFMFSLCLILIFLPFEYLNE